MSYHSIPTRPHSQAGQRFVERTLAQAYAGVAHFTHIPEDWPVRVDQRVRWLDWQSQTYCSGTVKAGASVIRGVRRVSVHIDGNPENAVNKVNVEQLEVVSSKVIPISVMTTEERSALARNEATIARGLSVFMEVGNALMDIRDRKLYRDQHATFEAYLNDRWGISRTRGYQLMSAAQTALELPPLVNIRDMNERQVRALKGFPAELRPAIVLIGNRVAEDQAKRPSHAIYERVGGVLMQAVDTGHVDTGSGESRAFLAALTVEEFETMQRQQAHIRERSKAREYLLKAEELTVCSDGRLPTRLTPGTKVRANVWSESE